MVRAQHRLVQRLGIERLHAVVGGCLGGQQALEWAITYPGMVRNAVVITTTPATSAHTIAIFSVMRHLIRADPQWQGGDYYGRSFPVDGLNARGGRRGPAVDEPRGHGDPVRPPVLRRTATRSAPSSRSRRSSAGWWPRPGTSSTRTA